MSDRIRRSEARTAGSLGRVTLVNLRVGVERFDIIKTRKSNTSCHITTWCLQVVMASKPVKRKAGEARFGKTLARYQDVKFPNKPELRFPEGAGTRKAKSLVRHTSIRFGVF